MPIELFILKVEEKRLHAPKTFGKGKSCSGTDHFLLMKRTNHNKTVAHFSSQEQLRDMLDSLSLLFMFLWVAFFLFFFLCFFFFSSSSSSFFFFFFFFFLFCFFDLSLLLLLSFCLFSFFKPVLLHSLGSARCGWKWISSVCTGGRKRQESAFRWDGIQNDHALGD